MVSGYKLSIFAGCRIYSHMFSPYDTKKQTLEYGLNI